MSRSIASAWDFAGTARFEIVRRLGAGGMGVVYEAVDRRQGNRVALKVMRRMDPASLLRFKQEFRSLADVSHPNLVGLHELVCEDPLWFVTMELVEGVSFLDWVRHGGCAAPDSSSTVQTSSDGLADTWTGATGGGAPAESDPARLDEARLRDGLYQLSLGIAELHRLGKLHRDIKPSNVLVTPSGRVVVLDFGLVKELVATADDSLDGVVGTPAYMAPEQASADEVTEASDWYAVGAMLYEALTGYLPFSGTALVHAAAFGPVKAAQCMALLETARGLAAHVDDRRVVATVMLLEAGTEMQFDRYRTALALYGRASTELRETCTDVAWELASAELFGGLCCARLGWFDELQRRVPALLREAEDRGNRYIAASTPGLHHMAWLASDRPGELRVALRDAMACWPVRGDHLQHFHALQATIAAALYDGDGRAGWRAVETGWPRLVRTALISHASRVETWMLRARAALAAAAGGAGRQEHLVRIVLDMARRLERTPMVCAPAQALLFRAGAATVLGDGDAASLYARAGEALERADLSAQAAAARWRRGQLLGGDEGAALIADAGAALMRERVKDPARLVALLAPARCG